MLIANEKKIKEKESELIRFPGFLPMPILNNINTTKRYDYLQKIGKYNEVQKLNSQYRKKFKQNGLEYNQQVLKEWVLTNPQFKDCIRVIND